jgi:hypothetical protein
MGLILRTTNVANAGNATTIKGAQLSWVEGDGNFVYLLTNMSGSIVSITGSTFVSGTFTVSDRAVLNNLSGSLFGTASWAQNAVLASTVSGGIVNYIPVWGNSDTLNSSVIYQTGGNIGVSTTSPTLGKLQVNGNVYAVSYTGSISGSVNGTASYATSTFNDFTQNGNSFGVTATLGTNDSQSLAFETSGSTRMIISGSGNVGIGMLTPIFTLDVSGSSRFVVNSLQLTGSLNVSGSGTFTNNATISGSLNVSGSGTFANNATVTGSLNVSGSGTFVGNVQVSGSLIVSGSGTFANGVTITGSLTVGSGSSVEFQVLDTGIRIGNTVSDIHNTTGSFNISGSSRFTGITIMSGSLNITGSLGVGTTGSLTIGRIDASNDVVAFATSDSRFKTNIIEISNALNKITQIGGYEFDWIPNPELHGYEGHDVGVIAQEMEIVLPEVVTVRDNGYKAVKYEKIIPLLIQAIKEQQYQIETLQSQINLINK